MLCSGVAHHIRTDSGGENDWGPMGQRSLEQLDPNLVVTWTRTGRRPWWAAATENLRVSLPAVLPDAVHSTDTVLLTRSVRHHQPADPAGRLRSDEQDGRVRAGLPARGANRAALVGRLPRGRAPPRLQHPGEHAPACPAVVRGSRCWRCWP